MDHRPYPPPATCWVMHQRWHDLLFAHWPVCADELRPLVPPELELDRFEGECWVGVVPFWMSNVRPRGCPPLPWLSCFPELNVRTYVVRRGKPGVFFFSLDAANPVAVQLARTFFHLPYFNARMKISPAPGSAVSCEQELPSFHYASHRVHRNAPPADLRIAWRPTAPPDSSASDTHSLPWWLTARYGLYTTNRAGRLYSADIYHTPWPLQSAEAEIEVNTMARAAGITLPDTAPLLHFSRRLDVKIWPLLPAT